MLYHVPGSRFYDQTVAEVWFATEADAEAAGFSAARLAQAEHDEADRRRRAGRGAVMKDPRDIILAPVVSREELRAHRAGRLHVQGPPAAPASPRSTTPSRRSGASRSSRSTPSTGRARRTRARRTNRVGHKPDTKRAIVTLAAGDEIPLFEN